MIGLTSVTCFDIEYPFHCHYYFEKFSVSFDLKIFRQMGRNESLTFPFEYQKQKGKILVNLCDGVFFPENCAQKGGNFLSISN